jgi:multidrug transporter EmrE-like cation transporter
MNFGIVGWMGLFWALQIVANIFFKWGSDGTLKWISGFALGHTFGITSMAVLMVIYKTMNPNIAFGVGMGGAFLLSQVALAFVFKTDLSVVQYIGIGTVVVGMTLLAVGQPATI